MEKRLITVYFYISVSIYLMSFIVTYNVDMLYFLHTCFDNITCICTFLLMGGA